MQVTASTLSLENQQAKCTRNANLTPNTAKIPPDYQLKNYEVGDNSHFVTSEGDVGEQLGGWLGHQLSCRHRH